MSGKDSPSKMPGKGKRRSARLLKLEEQKNDEDGGGGSTVCLLDPWQIIRNSISGARGKRKRNDEIQKLQGEASFSQAQPLDATYTNNSSSKSSTSTGQIIEYILDTLEMRDTHELFAMPDDIQASDHAELVNRPGDFATLRQKNKDGMYKTLEQFESDVYLVFQKAMSINSQDTIPYREAMSLLDQAKQVFMSLKSNQMYSERELLAWRQKHLDGPAREDGNNGGSRDAAAAAAATPTKQPANVMAKRKGAAEKKQSAKAGNASAENGGKARQGGGAREGKSTPVKRARKAAATAGFGGAGVEKRRLTYTDETDQGRGATTMPAFPFQDQHAPLIYQPQVQGHTYQESLRRFVRHAGLKARVAAEFKNLECDARARQQNPAPPYWSGFAPGASAASGFRPSSSYYPSSPSTGAPTAAFQTPAPSGGGRAVADAGEQAPPWCKLETDELLKHAMLLGTPAYLERAKELFGDTPGEESSKEGHGSGGAGGNTRVGGGHGGVTAAAPGQKSGASELAMEFGPFAPPKLVSGRLGFGQFAGSSTSTFKVKPPTSKSPGKKKLE